MIKPKKKKIDWPSKAQWNKFLNRGRNEGLAEMDNYYKPIVKDLLEACIEAHLWLTDRANCQKIETQVGLEDMLEKAISGAEKNFK